MSSLIIVKLLLVSQSRSNDLGVINPPSKFGDALFNTNVFGGGDNPLIRVPLQGSGTSNNFTIISDDTKAPYTINGFYVDYIPSGRR